MSLLKLPGDSNNLQARLRALGLDARAPNTWPTAHTNSGGAQGDSKGLTASAPWPRASLPGRGIKAGSGGRRVGSGPRGGGALVRVRPFPPSRRPRPPPIPAAVRRDPRGDRAL